MLGRLKFPVSVTSFIYLMIVLLFLLVQLFPPDRNYSTFSMSINDRLIADSMHKVNNSIPQYQYSQIEEGARRFILEENRYAGLGGGPSLFEIMGTSKYDEEAPGHRFYFYISGYDAPEALFYKKNGKDYVNYTIWTEVEKNGNKSGYDTTIETTVRFTQENNQGYILFPISKNTLTAINIILIILIVLVSLAVFYILLYLPLRFLYLVSKGEIFTDETIGSLHTISWFLLISGLLYGFLRVLLHLIFMHRIPDPVNFSYYDALMRGWKFIMAGLIILLIAKAFLKGSQLQKDQELTV